MYTAGIVSCVVYLKFKIHVINFRAYNNKGVNHFTGRQRERRDTAV